MFFYFLMFFCAFNVMFLLLKTKKTYKITNMMHFSWAKTLFPGQRVFCSSIIDLDSY